MKGKKTWVALILAVVMAGGSLLAACGSSSEATTTPAAETETPAETTKAEAAETTPEAETTTADSEKEHIVIAELARCDLWAPAYLAETLGYFDEEGLDVEFQALGSSLGAAIFAGDAQFGLCGVELPMNAIEQGQGCKILASTSATYPTALMGTNSDYSTIESLRGQVVGSTEPAGSMTAWLKACLTYGGLDPEEDVEISMVGSNIAAAIINGDVKAGGAYSVWDIKLEEEAGCVRIVDGINPDVFEQVMGSRTYEMYCMIASDEYIAEHPETTQKVVTAVAKAMKWMEENSPEDIAENLYSMFVDREDEILFCAQENKAKNLFSYTGYHTESGYAAAQKMARLAGMTTEDIPADQTYDESFLDNAWAQING